jgi:DNA-binding transcriptional ArsR family regulator
MGVEVPVEAADVASDSDLLEDEYERHNGTAELARGIDLAGVLHALSDPIRLRIVAQLADGEEHCCGSFGLPVTKSTCSHHFRVLREAGVISTRIEGKNRLNRLRREPLEWRFPGLLDAVLRAPLS